MSICQNDNLVYTWQSEINFISSYRARARALKFVRCDIDPAFFSELYVFGLALTMKFISHANVGRNNRSCVSLARFRASGRDETFPRLIIRQRGQPVITHSFHTASIFRRHSARSPFPVFFRSFRESSSIPRDAMSSHRSDEIIKKSQHTFALLQYTFASFFYF